MAVPIVIVPRDKCDSIYKSVKKSEVFQSPKAGTGKAKLNSYPLAVFATLVVCF